MSLLFADDDEVDASFRTTAYMTSSVDEVLAQDITDIRVSREPVETSQKNEESKVMHAAGQVTVGDEDEVCTEVNAIDKLTTTETVRTQSGHSFCIAISSLHFFTA